jgi:superoxide dismutase
MSPWAMMARKRRPVRGLLNAKRSRVRRQSKAMTTQLQHVLASPRGGNATAQINQLRATLHELRHEVLTEGAGKHTQDVAEALQRLDKSLELLAKATTTNDPNQALATLRSGWAALTVADAHAKLAGHDWPL